MDLPHWIAIYAGFALLLLAVWPLFIVKNFFKLMRSRSFFSLGVWLIVADQLAKCGMWSFLGGVPGNRVVLVPGYLDLTLVTNLGAAFGLFPGETRMFILMALFTIAIIVAYLTMIGEDEKLVRLALVCIMAGAIGNL
ncbi:MAG: signal peptidase II, partial [Candidatus Wallbacteria bacterium]|nr:signal peptidase II [Candidatus Wallbacteria bacterium]